MPSKWDELTYAPRAAQFLADHLQRGTLVVFLGAGASQGMGLPSWVDFVNNARRIKGLEDVALSPEPTAEVLQAGSDEVREACGSDLAYMQLLKECLYKDLPELSWGLLRNDLLTALCALLMGSKRGNVRRVVTLNFDSMLEWFLSMYGFIARVVYKLPQLEGAEDVRIYHPHGFLPHKSLNLKDSDFVLLGLDSVNGRIGRLGDPWFELSRHLLRSGVCLFVGLSERTFQDRALAPLLADVGGAIQGERPTGIWILVGDVGARTKQAFLRNNVVPLVFTKKAEVSTFLLDICKEAAKGGIWADE